MRGPRVACRMSMLRVVRPGGRRRFGLERNVITEPRRKPLLDRHDSSYKQLSAVTRPLKMGVASTDCACRRLDSVPILGSMLNG